jgi:hypothetical protein
MVSSNTVLLLFAAVGCAGKLVLELFDTSGGVHELQFARVKRMANAANIDFDLRFGRPRRKLVSATAGNVGLNIFRMNVLFHGYFCKKTTPALYPKREK